MNYNNVVGAIQFINTIWLESVNILVVCISSILTQLSGNWETGFRVASNYYFVMRYYRCDAATSQTHGEMRTPTGILLIELIELIKLGAIPKRPSLAACKWIGHKPLNVMTSNFIKNILNCCFAAVALLPSYLPAVSQDEIEKFRLKVFYSTIFFLIFINIKHK